MAIDFDNVLKLGFNTGSNGAALTITHVGGELPIPPVVLFSGLISESALTTELLEGGLHYNYFAFDQIMGVPNPEDGALYNITDKEMQIVISSMYNGGVPNPGNLTLNSSFREWVVDYLVWNSELEVMESVAEIDWSGPVSFDELVIHFPAGSTPTLNVPVILLSNTNDRDIGVNVSVTGDNVIENHGTAESYTLTDTTGSFCLMQRREVGEPIQNQISQCFGLEGLFAIEINGEVVPHYFKAEDLPAYFNANNPHNVQFVECPGFICVPSDIEAGDNGIPFTAGDWFIDFAVDGGPVQTYTVTLEDDAWQRGVWQTMIQDVVEQANDNGGGISLVGGGGGLGHFQLYNWNLWSSPVTGGANSKTLRFIRNSNHRNDLYWYFFDHSDTSSDGEYKEAISCGIGQFDGL